MTCNHHRITKRCYICEPFDDDPVGALADLRRLYSGMTTDHKDPPTKPEPPLHTEDRLVRDIASGRSARETIKKAYKTGYEAGEKKEKK